jgi:hypothetical protein
MTTLNEIIYDVLNKIRPRRSDEEPLSKRQMAFDIGVLRARFLRNEFNKNRTIDPAFVQDLGCIPLEAVDRAECCEVDTGCHVVRTTMQIPGTIEQHNSTTLTRVGPVDKLQIRYSLVPYERAPFVSTGRFNQKQVYAYLKNKYIYLVSADPNIKHLAHVNVQGVFEDPRAAIDFVTCDNAPCYSDDGSYPINKWLVDAIIRQLIQDYSPASLAPTDVTNDAASAVTPQQQQ